VTFHRKLAIGDFRAQMTQVIKNITAILKESGCGWYRFVRTKVFLTRRADFDDMNQIYAAHFPSGKSACR